MWHKRLFILCVILVMFGCSTGSTPTPIVTVTPVLPTGDTNCFGVRFPNGYTWATGNPCFNGGLQSVNEFEGYVNSDGRRQYWYGAEPSPYNHYRGAFVVPLIGTPAWINAGDYPYLGGIYRALEIDVTEINGRVGVQYGQNFQTGACYDFKLFIRSAITQNFNPDNVDVRMEIHTTDGQSTTFENAQSIIESNLTDEDGLPIESEATAEPQLLLNVHSIPNPFASYELTWRGYHNGSEAGQILMYLEIRFANMRGNVYVFSAGTLRAPTQSCFDGDGSLADGVYGF